MYLKEIQAYGFKSFADKLDFEFTNNINGIVGPNGSGKSNVVDAVRWVLGEQSNKSLRLTDATSVIFSGSKSRKPLNSASVNIVFDNTDRTLPIDFNEVSIKRTLYRSGENEYYINNAKCRLKDVTELLVDSGAAKESFNIIGQGKIDEILSTKPYDRRVIFEEAAGVLKYKKRKEEAIRKLDRTNLNKNRVNDIINELNNNLIPLEGQANDAKRYLEIKDKLTNLDVSLMTYDVANYTDEFNINKDKIRELNDKIVELSKNNSEYDINILTYKERINNIQDSISNYNNKLLELTKKLDETDADIRIYKERIKYVKDSNQDNNIISLKDKLLSNRNDIFNIVSEIDINKKKIDNLNIDYNTNIELFNGIKNELNKYNKLLSDNKMKIEDLNYKIRYNEELINNGGNMPNAVKAILNNPRFMVHGVISSLMEIQEKYSLAVSTSMGSALNYLVVDSPEDASKMVNYLKENKLGRATFFPLDTIKARYVDNDNLSKIVDYKGYINTLDKVVNYNNKYENIIMNQLGNVILCDTIENANKISNVINNKYKIVTLDGQVVNVGGSITGGENIHSNDIISKKYELKEYYKKIENINNINKEYESSINSLNKEYSMYEDKISSIVMDKNNLLSLNSSKENIKKRMEEEVISLEKEINDIENITGNKDNVLEELMNKYYEIKNEIDEDNKNLTIKKIEYDKANKDLLEIEDISKNSNSNISKLEKNLKDIELRNSKLEMSIDNILNSLNEDYSITYNEAKEKYILEGNVEEVRREVSVLKNKLKDYEMVNLGAISEYERIKERYDFLTKQRDDLDNATNTLLEIISDMDNIMKDKFINTFNDIRMEFKKVFKELFKGGEADIYLTEPDNILETGIELEATPPGKNLKSIQALSGGERTFTAISLLFAILNVRPVPFCLFDEVEAALDEANVIAFAEYLNKYRNKTQFIIITHKKKTMEFVDTLYGLTMQESGVSKRVSVKLNEIKNN